MATSKLQLEGRITRAVQELYYLRSYLHEDKESNSQDFIQAKALKHLQSVIDTLAPDLMVKNKIEG